MKSRAEIVLRTLQIDFSEIIMNSIASKFNTWLKLPPEMSSAYRVASKFLLLAHNYELSPVEAPSYMKFDALP